jgi:hypothetical protein
MLDDYDDDDDEQQQQQQQQRRRRQQEQQQQQLSCWSFPVTEIKTIPSTLFFSGRSEHPARSGLNLQVSFRVFLGITNVQSVYSISISDVVLIRLFIVIRCNCVFQTVFPQSLGLFIQYSV